MRSLVLSAQFIPHYEQLQKQLPQSVLLSGPSGVGLFTVARSLSKDANTLILTPVKLTKTSTTKQISIEMVRELYNNVRTNTKRIVVIDDADAMTIAAQNALLKLLEEPNMTTRFILTSHHPELLLPTIRSRVATFHISLVETMIKLDGLLRHFDEAKQRQLRFLSHGKPAELRRLTENESYFEVVAQETSFAKKIISETGYDRVISIAKMKLDRDTTLRVIERAIDLLQRTPTPQTIRNIESLANAYASIRHGGNAKLQLLNAML
jgi:DNA polymerase III delta prime subunit